MLKKEFTEFLSKENLTKTAVESRVIKAKAAEDILKYSFDEAVKSDEQMFKSLIILKEHDSPIHGQLQNALRKYYKFKNGIEFPPLRKYIQHFTEDVN